jgi:6-phosphogluconolactonase
VAARPPDPEIRVFPDAIVAGAATAVLLAEQLRHAWRTRGRASIALAGGSTPRAAYERLAGEAGDDVRWSAVDVCFGDERVVPPDHADSNYAMARRALLDHVAVEPARVHRVRGELPAAEAAADYERTLRRVFADAAAHPDHPMLDVALLGVGDDGHTASLFPGDAALEARDRWVSRATAPPASPVKDRVTLTFSALDRSRVVCFLCAGAGKAAVLRRILVEGEDLPAARVRGVERTVWMMDEGAAAGL